MSYLDKQGKFSDSPAITCSNQPSYTPLMPIYGLPSVTCLSRLFLTVLLIRSSIYYRRFTPPPRNTRVIHQVQIYHFQPDNIKFFKFDFCRDVAICHNTSNLVTRPTGSMAKPSPCMTMLEPGPPSYTQRPCVVLGPIILQNFEFPGLLPPLQYT